MAKDNNDNRELTLEEREALLEDRSSELSAREAATDSKESDLNDLAVELDQREKALNQREQALDEREKALTKLEATLEAAGGKRVLQVEEKRAGHAFSFRGKQYQFADDAPLQILFGGERYTQEELAADEEALVQLIGGGSALIVKSEE
ncbi:hypothetical protein [Capnocytophaga gingivalis]|uniref:hypothetical protein n=1 Tax=Capnocytophaga gingivalis TaxID=1017 RepID=UPI0023F856CF|nr:hypothetical protein [Capnocytophaga gingivalis]